LDLGEQELPEGRLWHTAVLYENQMLVYAGYKKKPLGDFWSFHLGTILYHYNGLYWILETKKWSILAQPPLRPRSGHIAGIIGTIFITLLTDGHPITNFQGNKMLMFTGEGHMDGLFFSDSELWTYDIGK
jgi:hypothetical protein